MITSSARFLTWIEELRIPFFSCCFHATPSEISLFSMRPACRGRKKLHVRKFAETSLAPLRLICMSRINPLTLVQISPALLQDACARASICKPAAKRCLKIRALPISSPRGGRAKMTEATQTTFFRDFFGKEMSENSDLANELTTGGGAPK